MHIQADGGDVDIKAAAEIHETATNIHLNSILAGDASPATKADLPDDVIVTDQTSDGTTIKQTTRNSILYNWTYHEPYNHAALSGSAGLGTIDPVNAATDPYLQTIRSGETLANQSKPLDIIGGSPKPGMPVGNYTGTGYDDKGNPTYEFSGGNSTLSAIGGLKPSENCLAFIRKTETYQAFKYEDPRGQTKLYSVGYGHQLRGAEASENFVMIGNNRVGLSRALTLSEAEQLFQQDVKTRAEDVVKKGIKVSLTQSQYDALVSFSFNTGAMPGTKLAQAINAGNLQDVTKLFMEWVHAGGKVNSALVTRRTIEARVFTSGTRFPV